MDLYDQISDLGKRRSVIFPSFEIYGGVSGFFDYGPIGTLLKHNIENKWRQLFVQSEGMVEIESTTIMPEQIFQASGHLAHFTDMMTRCLSCNRSYRVDVLLGDLGIECPEGVSAEELDRRIEENNVKCPVCGGQISKSEPFNLMFQVKIGSYIGGITGYGRPEAAQGQFLDFKRIYASERERLPLGIAQVGRCVRNEIAPRKGPIRLREFTIIDYEVFLDPEDPSYPRIKLVEDTVLRILSVEQQTIGSDEVSEMTVRAALDAGIVKNEVLCYFMALAGKFLEELGIPSDKQRFREALPEERAHYSLQTFDQEVWLERWGWTEVSGHAYRTDYDLRNHMTHSGVDLRVYKAHDQPRKAIELTVTPKKKQLELNFGTENAQMIVTLLSRSDASIVAREVREKGYYELTGPFPLRLTEEHIEVHTGEVEEAGRYFIPHVVEPSFGIDRILYAVLEYAYLERKGRIVLNIPRDVASVQACVFPLVNRDDLPKVAKGIYETLLREGFTVEYDDSGSIGRRYARADEIGVPICMTVDYQTLQDGTVTLRDVSTWKQIRSKVNTLSDILGDYLKKKVEFDQLGIVLPTNA